MQIMLKTVGRLSIISSILRVNFERAISLVG